MIRSFKFASTFIVSFIVFIYSCKKETEQENNDPTPSQQEPSATDILSSYDASLLDSLEIDSTTQLSDLHFDDGTSVLDFMNQFDPGFLLQYPGKINSASTLVLTPKQEKQLFLARMQVMGFYLTTRSNHIHLPLQPNGLAYVFGSKQYAQPQGATEGLCLTPLLYGVDCSGMIYQMALSTGLSLGNPGICNASFLNNISNWNNAFQNSTEFKHVRMRNISKRPYCQMAMGDIISWGGDHTGVILNDNVISIFSSTGYNGLNGPCAANTDNKHGPNRKFIFKNFTFPNNFNNGNYDILRPTVTDSILFDGFTYHTIDVGSRTWFKENLKNSHYNNGDNIPTNLTTTQWQSGGGGGYGSCNNNPSNDNVYGKLYRWYTISDPRGLCPTNWHVATEDDWLDLINSQCGLTGTLAGDALREVGSAHWVSNSASTNNSTDFTALPGGDLEGGNGGATNNFGNLAIWWTSTSASSGSAYSVVIGGSGSPSNYGSYSKRDAFSVRCVKD